ncbi:MAG: efflux RND transporter periplasmic adaptor subunit [Phycisphaerales bacterium]
MVVTDAARLETIEQQREVTGEIRALRQSVLASQEEGWVIQIQPREGDLVHEGQVVARLDDALAKIELARAESVVAKWEADLAERTATVEKAERDLKKFEAAASRGGASETEVPDARSALAVAQARVDQAKAERATAKSVVDLAKKRLRDLEIKSPITGRVASRRTEVGQWVGKGDPVIEIVQLDIADVWLNVPESLAPRLQRAINQSESGIAGGKVENGIPVGAFKIPLLIDALGEERLGSVVALVPRADPLSRLVPIRVLLENKDEIIRPGMSVRGVVPVGASQPTLTISKDALLRGDSGPYVYFNAGGVAAIAHVDVLFGVQNRLAIRSPQLRDGTPVVVEGNERLFPGQPLAPTPRAAPAKNSPPQGNGESPRG